jgi:hypothetical protein
MLVCRVPYHWYMETMSAKFKLPIQWFLPRLASRAIA